MTKFFRSIALLAVVLAPMAVYANAQPAQQAHKPPILTTTAIIEIHGAGQFKGIVLIERGKLSSSMIRKKMSKNLKP
jgi:8-oxo-dGTP diphosphatase